MREVDRYINRMNQCTYLSYRWSVPLDFSCQKEKIVYHSALPPVDTVFRLLIFDNARNESKVFDSTPDRPRIITLLSLDGQTMHRD